MPSHKITPSQELEAEEIRRQVEYYFSDQNLPSDKYLLNKTRGAANNPVPISTIHTFKKMQKFQPYSFVVNSLKESAFLEITEDDCIKRKVPLPASEDDSDGEPINRSRTPAQTASKKPQKGMAAPTGFEEFFTDPPISAAEFKEEEDIYSQDKSFAQRIETAIQRYQAKRKFHSEQRDIFHKWMRFGGIDMDQKQYSGGLDTKYLEEHSKAEIAEMTATSYVGDDKEDLGQPGSEWAVDFEGLAKGFLSSLYPYYKHLQTEEQIKKCTNILRNFYNYLLHHNVCPEYKDQLYAARKICDLAERELVCVGHVSAQFPGDFNVACSTLYGGHYQGAYAGDQAWAKDSQVNVGMSDKDARKVSMVVVAALATDEQVGATSTGEPHLAPSKATGLQVTGIELANVETQAYYRMQSQGLVRPAGKLFCKTWNAPDLNSYDLPSHAIHGSPETTKYTFFVEEDILRYCFVDMKFEATVRTLNNGITYFDEVASVHCSFYTYLNNELMRGWKDVKYLSGTESRKMERTERNEASEVIDIPAVR